MGCKRQWDECHSQQGSIIASMCLSEYTQAPRTPDSSTLLNKSSYLTLSSCCQDILCPNPFSLLFVSNDLQWSWALYPRHTSPRTSAAPPSSSSFEDPFILPFGSIWLLWPTFHPDFTSYFKLSTPKQNHPSCWGFSTPNISASQRMPPAAT